MITAALREIFRCGLKTRTTLPHNLTQKAKIQPLSLLWVDPDVIEQFSVSVGPLPPYVCGTKGGEWDQHRKPFEENIVYRSFRNHFEEGCAWEDTKYYRQKKEQLEQVRNGTLRLSNDRVDTVSEYANRHLSVNIDDIQLNETNPENILLSHFNHYDWLYETLKKEGYHTQRELEQRGIKPCTISPPEVLEISVFISREGDILFGRDGQHRLSLAKIIGVDQVPTFVQLRHKQWQQLRNEIALGVREPGSLMDHPDLSDLNELSLRSRFQGDD